MGIKFSRNAPCPCGAGPKYKDCCYGSVDWNQLVRDPEISIPEFLSTRGKNLLFLDLVAGALQLDKLKPAAEIKDFKRAFTPAAVKEIFQALLLVWPSQSDLRRVLDRESRNTSGLLVTNYDPKNVLAGIARQSIYADTILLMDPLPFPRQMKEEYNPLVHPEEYRGVALRWIWTWLTLAPWIEAGLVRFIRNDGDFDVALDHEGMRKSRKRYESHPELKALLDTADPENDPYFATFREQILLGIPDDAFRRTLQEKEPDISEEQVEAVLAYLERKRDESPYFIEPLGPSNPGEMIHFSMGATLEMYKWTAARTKSHLITDMRLKWKEIEADREYANIDTAQWSPFAKAFQELDLPYLKNVPLGAAYELRTAGRLENMRHFLRKVWNAASGVDSYADVNAVNLAAELHEEVRKAEIEWSKIGRDVMRWVGGTVAGGLIASAGVATGGAGWVAAGLAVTAATGLATTRDQRWSYKAFYPAGFFLDLKKGRWQNH